MIPSHWQVKKLKFVADLRTDRLTTPPAGLRYVGLEHIESKMGRFAPVAAGMQTEAESTVNCFRYGDVLFGKLRPYLAKAVVADSDGCCSSEILVFRTAGAHPEYLKHVLLLDGFIQAVNASTFGSKMPRADAGFISQMMVSLPPLEEQGVIASFLDVETARIDALVAEKKSLCVLLEELRASIIREHITGSSNDEERVIVDSQFISSLPASWKFLELRRHAVIGNGSTPSRENPRFWEDGCFPWLNSSVVNSREITEGSEMVTATALEACHLPIVPVGSVVVALIGQGKTRGTASILRIEATLSQNIAFITPDVSILDGDFLCWCLTSQRDHLRMISEGRGAGQGALNCDVLARFRIPLPPLDVQKSIVVALNKLTKDMDILAQHVEREIILLQEVRNATITDAVLGRIDVRETLQNKKELEAA